MCCILTEILPRWSGLKAFGVSFLLRVPDVTLAVAEPTARRHLLLREELHAFPALHVEVAEERIVPAVERKPGHRSRHADVDANHAAVETMLELARRFARSREDGRAIAIK